MPTTETELKLIAAAAIMRLSSRPKKGYRTPAAIGNAQDVVNEGEKEILLDIRHRRPAQQAGTHDSPQIALNEGDPALCIATSVPVPMAMPIWA